MSNLNKINAPNITASQGFIINGPVPPSYLFEYFLGSSVASAGDVNGDGINDIIVGAEGINNYAGAAYVIYGKSNTRSSIEASSVTSEQGFIINGASRRSRMELAGESPAAEGARSAA